MKYTDFLFSYPIRIYDGFSAMKAEMEEYKSGEPVPADFIIGAKKNYPDDIKSWSDGYAKDHKLIEIAEKGFPCTIVETPEGSYLCTLTRKEFEKRLNTHIEKIEEYIASIINIENEEEEKNP